MNYFSCILLLCLTAFTLVDCCNGEDQFCDAVKSIVDKTYSPTTVLSQCQSVSTQCQEQVRLLRSHRQAISQVLFHTPIVYKNKKYFISNFAHKNVEEAMTYCTFFGGYLAEIDDVNEYKELQKLVLNATDVKNYAMIAGSDAAKEGTWIVQRSGQPVKILDWAQNEPNNLGDEDCIGLWITQEAKMNDIPCDRPGPEYRFMCEIPTHS